MRYGQLWILSMVLAAVTVPSVARADMGGTIVQKIATPHYRLELDIGRPEQMFTAADAAKMHPSSGEIMVSGTMTGPMPGMAGMAAGPGSASGMGAWRHLELHVTDKTTGTAVEYAAVRITVTNTATGKRTDIPIAQMYGVKEGFEDWHYGNNALMPPGSYIITCEVNGDHATFQATIPNM